MAIAPYLIAGVPYVTSSQAAELMAGEREDFPDEQLWLAEVRRWVTRMRSWVADPRVPLDVARDPAGRPVRLPAPGGKGVENVLPWHDVVEVEYRKRTGGRGRRRRS